MQNIIQFGIPSLDALIGRYDISKVRPADINNPEAAFSLLEEQADRREDVTNALKSIEAAVSTSILASTDRYKSISATTSRLVAQMNDFVETGLKNHGADGALTEGDFWRQVSIFLARTDVSSPSMDDLTLSTPASRARRLRQFLSHRGNCPHDTDLQLARRLLLDMIIPDSIACCRHESEGYGFKIPDASENDSTESNPRGLEPTTSFCILGPDGTGKSVLGLHLASRYAADSKFNLQPGKERDVPAILYASTDLSYGMALEKWERFGLDHPNKRIIPFQDMNDYRSWNRKRSLYANLQDCRPVGDLSESHPTSWLTVADYLQQPLKSTDSERVNVAFIDLASSTAGDDWAFLNRILGSLSRMRRDMPRHLLIIDAVEGLETLVGEQDSFGQKRSRRSRIAQVLRMAAGKCHVAFIVEEPKDGDRQPEEFVTDMVLRMRIVERHGYSLRTVDVSKARGQENVRGQHRLVLRSGDGSTTGREENPDDPTVSLTLQDPPVINNPSGRSDRGIHAHQSYFHVFPSLHSRSRAIMKRPHREGETRTASVPGNPERAAFGIEYLDEMLGPYLPPGTVSTPNAQGVPRGAMTALIGDDGTNKSRLGRAFLSRCFYPCPGKDKYDKLLWQEVAVLLTTVDINARTLAARLLRQLTEDNREKLLQQIAPNERERDRRVSLLLDSMQQNIICRRLEIHEVSSSTLAHMVECLVEEAKRRLDYGSTHSYGRGELYHGAGRIRLVIDDWSTIRDTYSGVASDPLVLPFLKFYLEREGVTTLIIDTQPGGPEHVVREESERVLRALVNHHIYTWNVPFYGERRIAIAALPAVSDGLPVVVRELRAAPPHDSERLDVDPHFELYAGLERGDPASIPLQINLYAETDGLRRYVAESNGLFARLFTSCGGGQIIRGEDPGSYERLREFRYLQGDNKLSHTLVFQVDEFWTDSISKWDLEHSKHPVPGTPLLESQTQQVPVPDAPEDTSASGQLSSSLYVSDSLGSNALPGAPRILEAEYLNQHTIKRGHSLRFADPYGIFTLPLSGQNRGSDQKDHQRHDFFRVRGYGGNEWAAEIDRVPFMWDFGLLLLQWEPWERACSNQQVKDIWCKLTGNHSGQQVNEPGDQINELNSQEITWLDFFRACRSVAWARSQVVEGPVYAFDMDMLGLETFSSLVLEMWATEVGDKGPKGHPMPVHRNDSRKWGLVELLKDDRTMCALYRCWLLLGEVLQPSQFDMENLQFKTREAKPTAIAARHWYSTASDATAKYGAGRELIPAPLPGHYAVRGDWFLAVASGSRSIRLGFQAIDLLCSVRGNGGRLLLGAGLPVRHALGTEQRDEENAYLKSARTRLWDPTEGATGQQLTYGKLLNFGAQNTPTDNWGRKNFHWFWRSRLNDYDRQNRVWGRWLCRIMMNWPTWRAQDGSHGDGFSLYEECKKEPEKLSTLESFNRFKDLCEVALVQLMAATSRRNPAASTDAMARSETTTI